MKTTTHYQHLEPRPKSNYRQLWVKGRRIRAEVLYRQTLNEDQKSPQMVADDFDLPLEVVLECIDYCENNKDVLDADYASEEAKVQEYERVRALTAVPNN